MSVPSRKGDNHIPYIVPNHLTDTEEDLQYATFILEIVQTMKPFIEDKWKKK